MRFFHLLLWNADVFQRESQRDVGMYPPAGVREIWPDWEDEEAEVWGEQFCWGYTKWYFKNG